MPLTSTHWGTYEVATEKGRVTGLTPFAADDDPSPIGSSLPELLDHPTRIRRPAVRRGWLDHGPGPADGARGSDPFVEIGWDEAERLVAAELERVRTEHGNSAIYAGSYGWASAGRFHHAQSQIHRFLNCIGGYTRSVNTYSYAAAEVIVPHVLGSFTRLLPQHTSWTNLAAHCELFVAFGGLALGNGQMANGGTGRHIQREGYEAAVAAGVEFINISPRELDLEAPAPPRTIQLRPGSDTALILALCRTLRAEGLADERFLARYTVGYDRFAAYLDGETDGICKDAHWASGLTGVPEAEIVSLARRMASKRTMVSISWSLTRQQYGEQPFWAAISLAAMLGQIGTPGGGIGFGYAIANYVGHNVDPMPYAALPQGRNSVSDFIPVARVSDMLLTPGSSFDYNGGRYIYPDVRLVYWAGGNPFHHHQDLNRLQQAWQRPDTIIMHDWCWNASAKRADIVLPCTTMLERTDIGMTQRDPYIIAMAKAVEPIGEARDDYDILAGIARVMGCEDSFCEGRTAEEWVRHLWDQSRRRAADRGVELPDYDMLVAAEYHRIDTPPDEPVLFADFRADPGAHPLPTPSGRIELFSETVAAFGYADCHGHATWNEPDEWLGNATASHPLHLLGKQPRNKLHSQLDPGTHAAR
ncbi:MAG: molybdopterin-dependent oxidoreductase, partial [Rhodobiaceae bacterium]